MAEEEKKYEGYLVEIVESLPQKTGIYGEVRKVRCRVLEGKDKGRVIMKNMAGAVKKGDKTRVSDTSREARDIKAR
jgi:small subunit ribosomal protein S28e